MCAKKSTLSEYDYEYVPAYCKDQLYKSAHASSESKRTMVSIWFEPEHE